MLELRISEATIVQCLAKPPSLDALALPPAAQSYRVAPDELLVIGSESKQPSLVEAISRMLKDADSDSLVVDMTDGWSIVSVLGPMSDAVLTRVSAAKPPAVRPSFIQTAIGDMPARAIVLHDSLHVLVSSTVRHQVRARLLVACVDFGVQELTPASLEALPT